MTPNGLVEVTEFDTKDGIYDCAWSEVGHTIVTIVCICTASLSVVLCINDRATPQG